VCMCVCVCVCVCVCMCVCICIHIHLYTYIYLSIYLSISISISVSISISIYIYISIYIGLTRAIRKLPHTILTLVSQRFETYGRRCSVRPHTVHRPRLALGDGAATRVGSFALYVRWPLHILNLQYCMVYGIKRRGRWGGVYCAMVVQSYCNRVGFAGGGGNKRMIDFHKKALK